MAASNDHRADAARRRHLHPTFATRCALIGLLVAACGQPAAPSPPSVAPATGGLSAPPVVSLCEELDQEAIEDVLGEPTRVIAEASSSEICALRVDAVGLDVQVRIEDAFADLAAVKSAVSGGEAFEVADSAGYWSSSLHVLWVEDGGALYAIQLIGSDLPEDEAREVARRVAVVSLASLAR